MKTLVGAVDPWDDPRAPSDRLHPLDDAELVLGRPLRVFRQWRLSDGCLLSLNGEPWADPSAVATCHRFGRRRRDRSGAVAPHDAPDPRCSCGFYAFYEPGHDVGIGPGYVFGAAEVYGTLVCAQLGVRAQRMRILALTAQNSFERLGGIEPGEIARLDGVREYDSRAALLADYPQDAAWDELLRR